MLAFLGILILGVVSETRIVLLTNTLTLVNFKDFQFHEYLLRRLRLHVQQLIIQWAFLCDCPIVQLGTESKVPGFRCAFHDPKDRTATSQVWTLIVQQATAGSGMWWIIGGCVATWKPFFIIFLLERK